MTDKDVVSLNSDIIQEKFNQLRKKFKALLTMTRNAKKVHEIKMNLSEIEEDFGKMNQGKLTIERLEQYGFKRLELINRAQEKAEADSPDSDQERQQKSMNLDDYTILRNVPYEHLIPDRKNNETNTLWSVLNFFGREYLGMLGEQNMKMDYSMTSQRDSFFNAYNEVIRGFTDYQHIINQLEEAKEYDNRNYIRELEHMESKQYRDMMVLLGKFLNNLKKFIGTVYENEKNDKRVLLEPDSPVRIKGEASSINGIPVREAIDDLHKFIEEFLDIVKIPMIN